MSTCCAISCCKVSKSYWSGSRIVSLHYKFTYSEWYCARQGVGELARRIKSTLNRLWNSQSIFWFSQWSIPFLEWRLGWYGFLPLAGLIYWAVFFWKELNIDSLCFFFPIFIFLEMIYSQNDETSILEVLETIFFFTAQTSWTDL